MLIVHSYERVERRNKQKGREGETMIETDRKGEREDDRDRQKRRERR